MVEPTITETTILTGLVLTKASKNAEKLRYAPLTLCAHNERVRGTRPFHSGMVSPPKSERDRHKSERHASLPLEHS
ncbi:hypothetical protein EVAR_67382_1 [Eumeta japonica]|uniref:Uncharacterized protein n=1 Tax=Eumeta variegata TaxID=151549 RepID=A0A4C1ZJ78_EUMVA|nr:hypothetical protein EVAR_67382_1 [Eumeta japonica]